MDEWSSINDQGETVIYDTPKRATCTSETCLGVGISVPIPAHVDIAFCGDCGRQQTISEVT